MKCYIAGKIGNLPIEEYTEKFENAKNEVSLMGFIPVSPIDLPHEHNKAWESYLKEDITEMLKCDAVYALRCWKDSPGANIEIELAQDLQMHIIYQE